MEVRFSKKNRNESLLKFEILLNSENISKIYITISSFTSVSLSMRLSVTLKYFNTAQDASSVNSYLTANRISLQSEDFPFFTI